MTAAGSTIDSEVIEARPFRALARFLIMVLSSAALALITVLAIVFVVPDENDYGLASNLKQDRLNTLEGNKIVLVGGSNLAFGIVSPIIEEITDCPVVNMGMNGYFGVRYMLEEVKPALRKGDVVVLAFEWDNYFKSIDGSPANLFGVSKANPRALGFMTWEQRLHAASIGIPLAARAKLRRTIIDTVAMIRASGKPARTNEAINEIESFAGFTPEGDLTSHVGVQWQDNIEQAVFGDHVDPEVVPAIAGFVRQMEARGVRVVMSYTPYMASAYAQRSEPIEQAYALIEAELPGRSPRPPQDYLFDPSLFFDTVYHLNGDGRPIRSERLAGDIIGGDPPTCGGPA